MSSGLERAKEIYQGREKKARERRSQGQKIIGYFCCYPPVEFITALDMVPYRISGRVWEPITQADAYLETIMCPFIRSCFDLALRGRYDFLDGLVIPHSCDTVQRIYDIWKHYRPPGYTYFLNVPHMVHPSSVEFFRKELERFKKSLEDFAGREISHPALDKAIQAHQESRALLLRLYQLRRHQPSLLSGMEVSRIILAGMTLPVAEYNDLLRKIIEEASYLSPPRERKARVLVYGCEIDDVAFIQLVEECGATVVMDDLCTGSRTFYPEVEIKEDLLESLAARYLLQVVCPRTYRPRTGSRQEDLENRFGYLRRYIQEFAAEGAILYILRFCDTHELDAPDVKEYLQGMGVPVLTIEHDYSATTLEPLRTRVQAFVEMLTTVSTSG